MKASGLRAGRNRGCPGNGLCIERNDAHLGRPVPAVQDTDRPGLAAHLAILNILLRRTPTGINGDLDRLIAVRTVDRRPRLGRSIAEWKVLLPVRLGPAVVRTADHLKIFKFIVATTPT